MKKTITAIIAATAIGLLAQTAMAQEISIGAIMPLTGPASLIGTEQLNGVYFAVQEQNAKGGVRGHKIKVVVEDDQAKSDQAVLEFNKLADLEHLPLIFTAFSGPSLAMAPLATRKHVLLINAGAQSDKLATASPYMFNTLPTEADEVGGMVRYLRKSGKTTAAVLFENDAAGIGSRDDFVREFKASGGKILAQEPVQFGQTDYRPALLKLAAAKPEVLFVATTVGQTELADQLAQMKQPWQVAGTTFMENPKLTIDPNSAGLIHTQVVADASPELVAAFRKAMGADMTFFSRQYYNGTQIVFTLIDHLLQQNKPITGPNLRAALLEIKTFHGLVPMTFETNTAIVPIAIVEMNGKTEKVIATVTAH